MQSVWNHEARPRSKTLTTYDLIRVRILRGELQNTALDEASLARSLGVSRTPIREAFQRLAHEGLIEIIPNRGAIVKSLLFQDVREICQLRLCLEPEAARWAAGHIAPAALDRLEHLLCAQQNDEDADDFIAAGHAVDRQLHALVLQACGNARLLSVVNSLTAPIERLQVALFPARLEAATAEHLAIVRGLRARDGDVAAEAMRVHLEAAQRAFLRLISERGAV